MLRRTRLRVDLDNARLTRLLACACALVMSVAATVAPVYAQTDGESTLDTNCAAPTGLIVHARVAMLGGAQPGPGMPPRTSQDEALVSVPVQIRATDAPEVVIAEELTDSQGLASFPDLPSGDYWAVIPQRAPVPPLSYAVVSFFQDRSPIFVASQVTVPDSETLDLTLTAIVPLP